MILVIYHPLSQWVQNTVVCEENHHTGAGNQVRHCLKHRLPRPTLHRLHRPALHRLPRPRLLPNPRLALQHVKNTSH